MGLTVGFGTENASSEFVEHISTIAENYGYKIFTGLECIDEDVQGGLSALAHSRGWQTICAIRTPEHDDLGFKSNISFGIYQEFVTLFTKEIRPKFFDFCESLAKIASSHEIDKLGVFFATEWYKGERIRYEYGDVDTLIAALSLPGHCMLLLLEPEAYVLNECDEFPYLFDLKCK